MYGSMEKMFWKYFFVFFSLIVCIYCENWLNDDEVQSNREAQHDHQIYNQNPNQNQNHHVKSESRRLNGHYQHSFHNEAEIPLKHFQALSDDPVANGDSSLPFNVAAVDRKYVRRMNFRRRKISSSNHKKNIFRRGQRHRQNKNGNSLPFRDNKSISLRVFFLFSPLITQSKQSQTVLISVRQMSLFVLFYLQSIRHCISRWCVL